MLGDHRLFDFFGGSLMFRIGRLDMGAFDNARHGVLPRQSRYGLSLLYLIVQQAEIGSQVFFIWLRAVVLLWVKKAEIKLRRRDYRSKFEVFERGSIKYKLKL